MLNDQTIDNPAGDNPAGTISAKRAPPECCPAFIQRRDGKSDDAIVSSILLQSRSVIALLPIMGVVSVAFLVIGSRYQCCRCMYITIWASAPLSWAS
jgi:hypothetical protein